MRLVPKSDARLSRQVAIGVPALLAVLASLLTLFRVSLVPPTVKPRALEIGAASTTVLVDTPKSEIARLSTSTDVLTSLAARADLVGNLMASDPVLAYIGRNAGINPSAIEANAPITANVPRVIVEPGSGKNATDIIASADHYKLQIQADPTLPVLHIYTQAPSATAAVRLASASVTGLRDYLSQLATTQGVNPTEQVQLQELGKAHGGVVNSGARIQIALLTWITAFAIACCAIRFGSRVRLGWKLAPLSAQTPP